LVSVCLSIRKLVLSPILIEYFRSEGEAYRLVKGRGSGTHGAAPGEAHGGIAGRLAFGTEASNNEALNKENS